MKSSVFWKTFAQDLKWLEWSFKFFAKNWRTDSELVVCAPSDCSEIVIAMEPLLGRAITFVNWDQWPDQGYLFQQFVKFAADMECCGDLLTFCDSDCMLMYPTYLENDLCVDGKPIIWYTEYEKTGSPWARTVAHFMSLTPQLEFMRCFPFTYHRDTLQHCRNHIEEMHGTSLDKIIKSSPVNCSEFNIIGFYAYVFERDKYTWKHTDEMFLAENKDRHWHDRIRQFHNVFDWSDNTVAFLKDAYSR